MLAIQLRTVAWAALQQGWPKSTGKEATLPYLPYWKEAAHLRDPEGYLTSMCVTLLLKLDTFRHQHII